MRSIAWCLAALVTVPWATLGAQGLASLPAGARVRVTAPIALTPPRQVGTMLTMRGDSFVFRAEHDPDSVALALDAVTLLERSRGRHGHTWKGATIGFLVGAGAGVIAGLVSGDDPADEFIRWNAAQKAGIFGLVLGVGGGLVGAAIGATHRTEQWERVSLHVSAAPGGLAPGGARGLALSLAVRF